MSRRFLLVGGWCRRPATSGRCPSPRRRRRASSVARFAPPRRGSAPSSASTPCATSSACTRSTRLGRQRRGPSHALEPRARRRRTTLANLLHRGVACRSHLVRQSVRPQIETGRGVSHHWSLRAGATTSGGLMFGSSSQLLSPMKGGGLCGGPGPRPGHLIPVYRELALNRLTRHLVKGERVAAYPPLNPYPLG